MAPVARVPIVAHPDAQLKHATQSVQVLPPSAYDHFISDRAKRLQGNSIRKLFSLEKVPGMLSLLAGKPNPATFPITSVSFKVRHPLGDDQEITLQGDPLHEALQYNMIAGIPELVDWITTFQELNHARKREQGWRVSMGVGSQDLIHKCFEALFDEGDSVFVETPAYPGVVPLLRSMNLNLIEIPCDSEGIQSEVMADILGCWPQGKPKPKALYTVPVGSNPTGYTASYQRRKDVLHLASEHDFLILEDDPYYYLYYGEQPRPPSYFTLESLSFYPAGRVVRFDSLSKILSSGFRLGFVTGPNAIIDLIDKQTALSNLQPSTFAQGVVLALLNSWGHDTFIEHTLSVSAFYKIKRDVCVAAFERHLNGLCEWVAPEAGMFIWFKLNIPPDTQGEYDSQKIIEETATSAGVLALPGAVSYPCGRKSAHCRAAFSILSPEEMDEACRRLAVVVKEARGKE